VRRTRSGRRAQDRLPPRERNHSRANLRKSHAEVLDEVRKIAELLARCRWTSAGFEGNVSTAFGCTPRRRAERKRNRGAL
jgi:hypothetical protein